MEINNYIDVGDTIFNETIDILRKQIDENETRATFGQPLLPYAIDLRAQLSKTEEKAHEIHASAVRYGRDTHGTADEWVDKAIMRFRSNLLRMIHAPGGDPILNAHLQNQVYEVWPELVPARDLTAEETNELCELQLQADTLIDSLRQSINDAIEGLWAIATAEQTLISGTSANNQRLINDRTRCELAALAGIISTSWDRQAGKLADPPEQITRYFMATAPRRWSDKKQTGKHYQ